ncbi:MAG: porin [Enterovirga sp.]|jgi:outer membrane immunogenic protein|nr:porin [Enterovirga sp.]
MKKILLSSVALLGLTAGAMAADLPSRRAPAPYVAVPVFTWTGFYVGVNAGYAFDVAGNSNNGGIFIPPGTFAAPNAGVTGTLFRNGGRGNDGFVGGGQVGYNYQMGNIVVGIEADAQYADLSNNGRAGGAVFVPAGAGVGLPAAFVGGNVATGIDWFGTVRGRIGYAWDRMLVYGTGGFAYGDGPNNNFGGNNRGSIRTGWTGGGGVEYAFTPNVTAKIEALYVNLDANNTGFIGTIAGVPVTVANNRRFDNEFVVVRAGLNYKFNSF